MNFYLAVLIFMFAKLAFNIGICLRTKEERNPSLSNVLPVALSRKSLIN
jgi:hypothetical protein